jgi:UDP-N-acetylmuramoyl-L-alanyl-D-glutamate--2,6-diaminopimelate ligase
MRLQQLLPESKAILTGGWADLEVTTLTADSRSVEPGALFVAMRGTTLDGHKFLEDAARRGALFAVGEDPDPGLDIPYLQVPDSRRALAQMAAAWHGFPARKLVMIGVTGTDGKTTTCNLIHQILLAAGIPTGMITTVNAVLGDHSRDTGFHVTTPDPLEVQAYLAEMVEAGLTHCVLEATSHGLAQQRVGECDFDIGVVTNITHEHLDYHGSYEEYRNAKGLLFSGLADSATKDSQIERTAVLNRDDSSYDYLRGISVVRQLSYGTDPDADLQGVLQESDTNGLRFSVRFGAKEFELSSPLIGEYNLSNCLAAYAVAVEGLQIDPQIAARGIAAMKGIPGRMETIAMGQSFTAIVDFAHTPNALLRALQTARKLTTGRVIAVFGSAGLRDRAKRRMMAEVSARLADVSILTAEDPRTESLDAILEEMAQGARAEGGVEGSSFLRVPDRGEALRVATRMAQPDDLVISCGKGHEQSMCFGEVEHPWDDRTALRAALAELLEIEGPAMPRLPTSET